MPFLIAFGLALLLTPAARRLGIIGGLVDRPLDGGAGSELKIHRQPVPILGGLAVAVAALTAAALAGDRPSVEMIVAAGIAFATGLADDVRPLKPVVRIALLAGAGAALALDHASPTAFTVGGTILLVLACANAVNLIDGQDGIAAGTGTASALGLAAALAIGASSDAGASPLALAGALCGFFVWNKPPARIFLGNAGAYLLGLVLSAAAVDLVWRDHVRGLVAAALCLGVFAFEIGFTVGRRLLSRTSLTAGDRWHTYDLLARVVTRSRSTAIVTALAAASSGAGVVVASGPRALSVPVAATIAIVAAFYSRILWNIYPDRVIRRAGINKE